ncbi:MAG: hypothetical protein IKO58_03175 [Prevotella sp.]|nr:hypothetical protein [Prevotella sp.]
MKLNRFVISFILLACAVCVLADDSISVQQVQNTKYERRMQRRQQAWASLIPTHYLIQNAGNMGTLSAGVGWSYGKNRKWELDLLFGFIPKHDSSRPKFTTTLKGNYIPWRVCLNPSSDVKTKGSWNFEPLSATIYLNTVYGHEFWKSQPGRYPDKYYEFMSTKFRLNVGVGERIMFKLPEDKKIIFSRMSLFYEISTTDLYIRSLFQGNGVKFSDIFGCSIGMKFYTR